MSEQLSMFGETPDNQPKSERSIDNESEAVIDKTFTELDEYEALDYQLAELMVKLNAPNIDTIDIDKAGGDALTNNVLKNEAKNEAKKQENKTLKDCTLEISKNTREGCIAIYCDAEKQSILLHTKVVGKAGDYKPLILDQDYLYLNRYWQYQSRLADQITMRMANTKVISDEQSQWIQKRVADYFPNDEVTRGSEEKSEINWQKRAAELALQNNFLIVSGGPGTGKTTTITRLLALLIENHLNDQSLYKNNKSVINVGGVFFNILLAAPTGKAAIRMLDSMREATESIKRELNLDKAVLDLMPKSASTIHKLLGFQRNSTQFKNHKNNTLNADIVLIDEASMIDIALMSKLIEAVAEDATFILIGDKDQLASVETGSVFTDICDALNQQQRFDSKKNEYLVTLSKNWRFSKDSDIGQSAIAANLGDSSTLLQILKDDNRQACELISPESLRDDNLVKPWVQYFNVVNNPESTLPEIFEAFNKYRVLCALRRGYNGSEIMNSRIETALDKQGLIQRRGRSNTQNSNWYHGRPIMISQNSYNKGLMNGDTGITLIRDGELSVYFPDSDIDESLSSDDSLNENTKYKSFSPIRLPAHETTWSMTIHKSQGSEFDQVVLILPQEIMPLLTRQLVYTGITRAKKSVSIVASEAVLTAGIKTEAVSATKIDNYLT